MEISRTLKPLWFIQEFLTNGIHGFRTRFLSRGSKGFYETVESAFKGTNHDVDNFITEMRLVQKQALEDMSQGFRVDIGDNFVTIYPNAVGTIRDSIDPSTGHTIVADPNKLTSDDIDTRVGCTVAKRFHKKLRSLIEWKKTVNKNPDLPDEEDDTQDPYENNNSQTIDSSTGQTADPSTGSGNDGMD